MADKRFDQLGELICHLLDDELSVEQASELTSILEESEEMRRYYVEYMDLDMMLVERRGPETPESVLDLAALCREINEAANAKSKPNSVFPKLNSFPFTQLLLVAVAGLLLANFFWLFKTSPIQAPNAASRAQLEDGQLKNENNPQLVGMTACVWESESHSLVLRLVLESWWSCWKGSQNLKCETSTARRRKY